MAIFSYNVLLKTEKMEIIKQQFASISTDKSIQCYYRLGDLEVY